MLPKVKLFTKDLGNVPWSTYHPSSGFLLHPIPTYHANAFALDDPFRFIGRVFLYPFLFHQDRKPYSYER